MWSFCFLLSSQFLIFIMNTKIFQMEFMETHQRNLTILTCMKCCTPILGFNKNWWKPSRKRTALPFWRELSWSLSRDPYCSHYSSINKCKYMRIIISDFYEITENFGFLVYQLSLLFMPSETWLLWILISNKLVRILSSNLQIVYLNR